MGKHRKTPWWRKNRTNVWESLKALEPHRTSPLGPFVIKPEDLCYLRVNPNLTVVYVEFSRN